VAVVGLLRRGEPTRTERDPTTVQRCGDAPPGTCPCHHDEQRDRGKVVQASPDVVTGSSAERMPTRGASAVRETSSPARRAQERRRSLGPEAEGATEAERPEQPGIQRAPDKRGSAACPGYTRGEVARSRTAAGILTDDTRLLPGHIHLMDFGVNRRDVKSTVRGDKRFQRFVREVVADPTYRISILGLDDCVGSVPAREQLRHGRAQQVLTLFGRDAQSRVTFAGAADAGMYAADNRSSGGRAMNRGVLIGFHREEQGPGEVVKPKRKPKPAPTADCDAKKAADVQAAYPVAKAMVERALRELYRPSPKVLALMRKYFNDDGSRTQRELSRGLRNIKERGLDGSVTFECDDDDDVLTRCGGSVHGWAIPYLGWRVHLCEFAFKHSTTELASTLIHELSHLVDNTWKTSELDCTGGCPPGVDRFDLYDNADSYARFAEEAYALP
jgi:hypothetical protein